MEYFIRLVFFIFIGNTFAQNSADELINSGYFHDLTVEKFFIHTNKNTYFNGEKIWFKTYIATENSNLPFNNTTNLYLSLYNNDGELIQSKLYFAENGLAHGEFYISDKIISGDYYLQANTNYNRNFNKNNYTKVNIVNISNNTKPIVNKVRARENTNISNELDLKFYPESNKQIKNTSNKIIFKFNLKKSITGNVIDVKTNKIVGNIKSDSEGMGYLFLYSKSQYQVKVIYNDKEYSFNVPKAKDLGFTIFKNRTLKNNTTTDFILKTNTETLNNLSSDELFAVLHRNGALKTIAVINLEKEKKDYILKLDNSILFSGLNTISLFNNENQIIAERNFYNTTPQGKLFFLKNNLELDSLSLSIKPTPEFENANISISVHDIDYENTYKNSIVSQFNIDHYLDTNFSFSKLIDNENERKIDDYLQILSDEQNNFPYKKMRNDELLYKNEGGVKISGALNTEIKDINQYKVLLVSKDNDVFLVTDFIEKKKFIFDNVYIKESSSFQIALLDKNGKIKNSNFVLYKNHSLFNPNLNIKSKSDFNDIIELEGNQTENSNFDFIDYKGITELDEVTINAEKIDEELNLKDNLKSKGIMGLAFSDVYSTDDPILENATLAEFIEGLPGVSIIYNLDNTTALKNERFPKTISDFSEPIFTISENGIPIGTDFTIYQYRRLKDFEYVLVNSRSMGFGLQGGKGVITLITKDDTSNLRYQNQENIKYFEAELGFNISQNRFENNLINYGLESNENKLSCLDWFPSIQFKNQEIQNLKVFTKGKEKIKLIVNGFNDSGQLIHQIIKL